MVQVQPEEGRGVNWPSLEGFFSTVLFSPVSVFKESMIPLECSNPGLNPDLLQDWVCDLERVNLISFNLSFLTS